MKNKGKNLLSWNEKICGLIFVFILGIVPFIVKLAYLPTDPFELQLIRNDKNIGDIFCYYKAVAFCIAALLLVISAALEFMTEAKFDKSLLKSNFVRLVAAYGVLAFVSALFSPYSSLAFAGAGERYEGVWVLLSYAAVAVGAFAFVKSEKHFMFIAAGLCLSVVLVGGIGVFQFFGLDIYKTDFFTKFIMGEYYNGKPLTIKFTEVFSTLYNPNCVGLYAALMAPVFAAGTVFLKFKDPFKYVSAVLFAVVVICLVGSDATGGMIGFLAAMGTLLLVSLLYFAVKKKNYKLAGVVGVLAAVGVCCCIFIPNVRTKIEETLNAAINGKTFNMYEFTDLYTDGNKGTIGTNYGDISLTYDTESRSVKYDMNGEDNTECVYGKATSPEHYKSIKEVPAERSANIETAKGTLSLVLVGGDMPFSLKGLSGETLEPIDTKSQDTSVAALYSVEGYGNVNISFDKSTGDIVLTDEYGKLLFTYSDEILKAVEKYGCVNEFVPETSELHEIVLFVYPYDERFLLRTVSGGKMIKRFEFKYNREAGHLNMIAKKGAEVDLNEPVPSMIFDNEYYASGRGFIWSRSIPLMLDLGGIFVGSGPDTFALAFPQNDMAPKLRALGNADIIVDKPHNMYIQMSVNTGLISLLAVLAAVIVYMVSAVKAIFRDDYSNKLLFAAKIGILCGIIGYLVTGLTTDSVISVAPTFWVLLGTGMALSVNTAKPSEK